MVNVMLNLLGAAFCAVITWIARALHGYQIDVKTVHSSDPGAFNLAIIANGAEGIDKLDAMIDDMEKNNPAGEAAFDSLLETHGHRDFLAHVDVMSHR